MSKVNMIKNYCTNPEEIIALAEQHREKFSMRGINDKYSFVTEYGESKMKSLFNYNMSEELLDTIFKTVPEDRRFVTSVTINRYDPGDYLVRHKDSLGGYWKFKLVFLRSDRPHFKWYDEDGQGHLVDEEPGGYLDMPITIEHEVTKIEEDEKPKYSMVLAWGAI